MERLKKTSGDLLRVMMVRALSNRTRVCTPGRCCRLILGIQRLPAVIHRFPLERLEPPGHLECGASAP
jgi:hypothetical protein